MDVPNERSLHDVPTPKLGGLAILVGVLVSGLLFLPWVAQTRAILGGAAVIAVIGVLDDVFDLPAGLKLLGQAVAATIPVFNGVQVTDFTLPFVGGIDLTHVFVRDVPVLGNVTLAKVLTVVGFVAIMNVINFIDGVDGLAAGVCAISAVTLSIIALSLDRPGAAVLASPDRRGVARVPAPRLSARVQLHGRHRLEPARLPAGQRGGAGRAEDERGRRPVLPPRSCWRFRSSTPGS